MLDPQIESKNETVAPPFRKGVWIILVGIFILILGSAYFVTKHFESRKNNYLSEYPFYLEKSSPEFASGFKFYIEASKGFNPEAKTGEISEDRKVGAKEYYAEALHFFEKTYASELSSDQEKAHALNLMNIIFIESKWNTETFKEALFQNGTQSDLDSIYQAKKQYYTLLFKEDELNQVPEIVDAVAIQSTLVEINKKSFALKEIGYPLLRELINRSQVASRLADPSTNSKLKIPFTGQSFEIAALRQEFSIEELQEKSRKVTDLVNKNTLYLGMGPLAPEAHVMIATGIWELTYIIATADQKEIELAAVENAISNYKTAVLMSDQVGTSASRAMIRLFAMSSFVNMSRLSYVDSQKSTELMGQAKIFAQEISRINSENITEFLKINQQKSILPENYPKDVKFFGRIPFYQARLMAMEEADFKTYLENVVGWQF